MTNTCTAVVIQDGKFWIAWIEEVPGVNCQAESREAREGYQDEKVTV
jgi:hypothetical protein